MALGHRLSVFSREEDRMYGVKINQSEVAWIPLDMPGVSMKVLHKDEATGAMAVW